MDDFFNPPDAASPADDFLRREREALGESFTTPSAGGAGDYDFESSASAFPDLDAEDGLGDFVSPPPAVPAATGFGGQQAQARGAQVSVTGTNEFAAFENEYPELEELPVAPVQVSFAPPRAGGGMGNGESGVRGRGGSDVVGV